MARVLIFGGRDFNDEELMEEVCFQFLYPGDTLIHGNAKGADKLAAKCAARQYEKHGEWVVHIEAYPADWEKYKKAAGPIRNQQMIDEGKPDYGVALPGGKGTEDMVERLMKARIKIFFPRRNPDFKGEGVRLQTIAWNPNEK